MLCFTNGYFLYDLIESLCHLSYPGRIEIIFHHTITISAISMGIGFKCFIGYLIIGLLVEISNIFLHLRQLLSLYDVTVEFTIYKVNSILTLGDFQLSKLIQTYINQFV